jgi:3'5'-cyclic nucleotide phosphodiesterase
LEEAGKGHWLTKRRDQVEAKGKGIMTTYWLNIHSTKSSHTTTTSSQTASSESHSLEIEPLSNDKLDMSIDWICEILQNHIKRIVSKRTMESRPNTVSRQLNFVSDGKGIPLDEVVESICLPGYHDDASDTTSIGIKVFDIPSNVTTQLRQYIAMIANAYRTNPFHNFEHACHVTMSVSKLLMRIGNPNRDINPTSGRELLWKADSDHPQRIVHDNSHGITSDPITIFAIVLAAVIHDVDHRGVSNLQLIHEEKLVAERYRCQSVAEQNSFDIAWSLLASDPFVELRQYIFSTQDEVDRFRQVFVNAVLATDIMDKELNELRQQRWNQAFSTEEVDNTNIQQNRKATIVIEHLIQASDVAHTMQHWHVYRKWNTLLFQEMYMAYQTGRMATNPGEFWYHGELAFFDNYIIPLAKKLKDCNVFGVSSEEYLNYAEKNRTEWKERGTEIVSDMMNDIVSTMKDRGIGEESCHSLRSV